MSDKPDTPTRPERRTEIDVMRALLVVGLILFHSARIYDLLPFYVKNEGQSLTLMILVGFASQWGMPLFFLIAGVAAWHSLSVRTPGVFAVDRLKRLVIPLVFGIIVLVPPQHYYALRTNPGYHESYWDFYPQFFRVVLTPDFPEFVRADPAVGIFGPAHLWFLEYLFAYSIVLLPLFVYLRGEQGRRLIMKLAHYCENGGRIFLFSLPVIGVETFILTEESTGWNRFAYIPFLISGFLFAADRRFERSLCRWMYAALILGTLTVLGFFAISVITYQDQIDPTRGYGVQSLLWRFLKAISSFLWITAILGLAESYRTRTAARKNLAIQPDGAPSAADAVRENTDRRIARLVERLRSDVNEAVMPVYILHQTVIVIVGFYIVKLNAGVGIKYALTVTATLLITLFLYDAVVKRTRLTRFLFGMKLSPPSDQGRASKQNRLNF